MPDSGYPNNLLELYRLNSLAGGAPQGQITPQSLLFIEGALFSLQKKLLQFKAVPFATQLVYLSEAVVVGDVVATDLAADATDGDGNVVPWVGRYSTIANGGGMPVALGMPVENIGLGSRCIIATMGPIEARFTGVAPGAHTAGTRLSVDLTTGKLKAWASGEEVLAYATLKGNVLFLGTGRVA